jgi:antibiotic biosynthesis monooxygenase (ABM) superfamily enzyme
LGILALLIVFEFLNLLFHPYIGNLTHRARSLMLGVMVCLAALLIPLHHKLEYWVAHKFVEKNNKIRLAVAKKTISRLEGNENGAPL